MYQEQFRRTQTPVECLENETRLFFSNLMQKQPVRSFHVFISLFINLFIHLFISLYTYLNTYFFIW